MRLEQAKARFIDPPPVSTRTCGVAVDVGKLLRDAKAAVNTAVTEEDEDEEFEEDGAFEKEALEKVLLKADEVCFSCALKGAEILEDYIAEHYGNEDPEPDWDALSLLSKCEAYLKDLMHKPSNLSMKELQQAEGLLIDITEKLDEQMPYTAASEEEGAIP